MLETRGFNLLMAFVCYQLFITALYFQYVENMAPCPLCIFQRVGVIALGLIFICKAWHAPLIGSRWLPTYSTLALIVALVGSLVAGRHVYIKNLPPNEVPACGPSLAYLRDMLPFNEVISVVLAGDGECAKGSWQMLGVSMPGWVLIFFITVILLCGWNIYRHFKPRSLF